MLIFSPTAKISKLADIEDSVRGTRIIVGDFASIDAFVKIKPAGGSGDVEIGSHSYINSGCVIYSGNGVRIGQHVLVAANCTFAAANHAYQDATRLIHEQRFLPSKGGIEVQDDVWLGANCVLLDGARVARGCVIGAGSVVRETTDPYGIYVGSPLRKIGSRV